MAYDAYNGTFLGEHQDPGAIRTGVFNNRETHNLAASDDRVYAAVGNKCTVLDAADGRVIAEYTTPDPSDGVPRAWAYLAYDQGQLFGTSTIREELEMKMRRRGLTVKSQTDAIFAVDIKTGERSWTYRGDNILHTTIAIGPDRVYFIDSSITPEERRQLYLSDKGDLKNLTGEAALKAEKKMKKLDVRTGDCAGPHIPDRRLWEEAGRRHRFHERQFRWRQLDADVSQRSCRFAVQTRMVTTGSNSWRANSKGARWSCSMPDNGKELWSKTPTT